MKKMELFGRRLIIGFEKKEKLKKEKKDYQISTKEIMNEKIIYMILILTLTVLSANFYMFEGRFKLGDVITNDIVAPTDIIYNDKGAREKIIDNILKNSPKQYLRVDNAEEDSMERINTFFDLVIENTNVGEGVALRNVEQRMGMKIEQKLFSEIYFKSVEELESLRLEYINDLEMLYELGIKKDLKPLDLDGILNEIPNLDSIEEKILKNFIKPNYVLDTKKTEDLLKEKVDQVKDVSIRINGGTVILKKGEMITQNNVGLLRSAGLYGSARQIIKLIGVLCYLLIVSIIFRNICARFLEEELKKKNVYRAIMLLLTAGIISLRVIDQNWSYVLPIETVFLLLGILINVRTSMIIGGFLILYSLPLGGFNIEYLIIEIFSLAMSLCLVKKIQNRTSVVNTGIYIGIIKVFLLLTFAVTMNMEFVDSLLKGGALFLSGAFTGMLTIALLPYFERTFNILTNIKLLELGDLSQPLLRKLSISAPGTFHHSMMVATLSERATEAIGGNHILARVASYYHDIGKMKRPQFYVENQADGVNPHNNLSPSMSTLIIISHTKDGDEMGREHNIPKEIRDIMYEHQGTTLLAYFYNKAKQTNPNLEENNFRYGGPKPRSKESAVIMLADSIEAAVRSLDEKSPVTIEKMLRKIIASKIEGQQLSDADLTFKEIEIIIKTFTKVLMSIHHVRIKYPGQK